MDIVTMTKAELTRLREELNKLESSGRAAIAQRIKTAREWGDLKENGEYHAAKEAQAHLETKILRLREQLRAAVVVEAGAADEVAHGATIAVTDLGTDRPHTYKLVSPNDAKASEGKISVSSPIAQALTGKRVGEIAEVQTPKGTRRLRIESID